MDAGNELVATCAHGQAQVARGIITAGVVHLDEERLAERVAKHLANAATEQPLLVDYPTAACLLGLCEPKPSESHEQALRRGVSALRTRVSRGEIPRRCIVQTGRRVQFRRTALVAFVNGDRRKQ